MRDWKLDEALELGIISEKDMTDDMQEKLDEFVDCALTCDEMAQYSTPDTLPSVVLESDHRESMQRLKDNDEQVISELQQELKDAKLEIRRLKRTMRDMRKKENEKK